MFFILSSVFAQISPMSSYGHFYTKRQGGRLGAAGRTLLSRSGRDSCTPKRVAGVQAFYSAGEVDKTVSWGFCVRQHEAVFEFHTYVRTIIRVFCETTFARSALGAQTADTDENSSSTEIV